MAGVGLDFSAPMLAQARERFVGEERIELVEHDLGQPLPAPSTSAMQAAVGDLVDAGSPPLRRMALANGDEDESWLRRLLIAG